MSAEFHSQLLKIIKAILAAIRQVNEQIDSLKKEIESIEASPKKDTLSEGISMLEGQADALLTQFDALVDLYISITNSANEK